MFLSAACIHVISCAVWHAACVFHWLRPSCCHVLCEHVAYVFTHKPRVHTRHDNMKGTRGLCVFSLAACLCLVLHMAGELFAGHVHVFLFCVSMWLLS